MISGYIKSAEQSVNFSKQTLAILNACHSSINKSRSPDPALVERSSNLIANQTAMLDSEETILRNLKALT